MQFSPHRGRDCELPRDPDVARLGSLVSARQENDRGHPRPRRGGSTLHAGDRDLESVRVSHRDVTRAPGLVGRSLVQLAAFGLDPLREVIDALVRLAVNPETFALLAVASLLPVVLPDHEGNVPGFERHADDLSLVLPGLFDAEPENVAVEREALLQVVDREARRRRTQGERLTAIAGLP